MKQYVLGCDECGYGSWSGPVVVGAVCADKDWRIDGLNDSKKLSDKQRRIMNDKLGLLIDNSDIVFAIAQRSNVEIDNIGLGKCLRACYVDVCNKLYNDNSTIIIDGNLDFSKELTGKDHTTLIKADTKIPAVMAASIIAKVYRDDLMIKLAKDFSHYNWEQNMGYGTADHLEAIKKYGQCEYHRKSYKIKGINI